MCAASQVGVVRKDGAKAPNEVAEEGWGEIDEIVAASGGRLFLKDGMVYATAKGAHAS